MAGIVLVISAVPVVAGRSQAIPAIVGFAGVIFGLFVAYIVFNGL